MVKLRTVRRYSEDITGIIISKGKYTRALRHFLELFREIHNKKPPFAYRVDIIKPERRRKYLTRFGKILIMRKKLSIFYGVRKSYFKLVKNKLKKKGLFSITNALEMFERRLATVVYRMHFAGSIKEGRELVKRRVFLVNKRQITAPDYLVNVGDIVEVDILFRNHMAYKLRRRQMTQSLFSGTPKYIQMNYKILMGIFIGKTKYKDVALPFGHKTALVGNVVLNK